MCSMVVYPVYLVIPYLSWLVYDSASVGQELYLMYTFEKWHEDCMDSYTQIKRDEGEILHAYQDTLGFWTICIGILIDKRKGGGLRPEESEFIFRNRLKLLEDEISGRLPWTSKLDPVRRAVLINMGFQLGVAGLLGFKNTLAFVQAGEYPEAASNMLRSRWAKQTPARANRLSRQMADGVWQ